MMLPLTVPPAAKAVPDPESRKIGFSGLGVGNFGGGVADWPEKVESPVVGTLPSFLSFYGLDIRSTGDAF